MALPYQMERYNLVFEELVRTPDTPIPHMAGISRKDAISVTKAHMATQGVELRGARFTGKDADERYLLLQGEYGYICLGVAEGSDRIGFLVSKAWGFTPDQSGGLGMTMNDLLVDCVLLGMKVPLLLQWYDSVCRKHTGRRVSPHFSPEGTGNKLFNSVAPALETLMKMQNVKINHKLQSAKMLDMAQGLIKDLDISSFRPGSPGWKGGQK